MESDSSSNESESDGEPIVYLNEGREKRVNAGNRMNFLLDQFEEEEEFKEEINDVEFIGKGSSLRVDYSI